MTELYEIEGAIRGLEGTLANLRDQLEFRSREQTAVTILAALLRNEAGSRRNDDEVCADAVALTDELRAKLAVKP